MKTRFMLCLAPLILPGCAQPTQENVVTNAEAPAENIAAEDMNAAEDAWDMNAADNAAGYTPEDEEDVSVNETEPK